MPKHVSVIIKKKEKKKSVFIGVLLTLKVPEKLQLYGLYVYYVVHICDFGMLRVADVHCKRENVMEK